MKGYSFRSLTDLVLKIFKTRVIAGTGLSGGGSLEADRTLVVEYGTTAGTAAQGNDGRLSNSREWTGETISQAETEAGEATTRRAFTAQRVRQAIVAWWNSITGAFGRDLVTSASNSDARSKLGLHASALRWPTWAEVTNKPTTFTPSSHTHPWAEVTGQPATATRWPTFTEVTGRPTNYPTTWASVAAKPAQATRWPTWGEVSGKPAIHTPIGVGQTWQDVTAQRATDTVYTNTTGRSIMVNVFCASGRDVIISVDGLAVAALKSIRATTSTQTDITASAVVPPGSTYRVSQGAAAVTQGFNGWLELR